MSKDKNLKKTPIDKNNKIITNPKSSTKKETPIIPISEIKKTKSIEELFYIDSRIVKLEKKKTVAYALYNNKIRDFEDINAIQDEKDRNVLINQEDYTIYTIYSLLPFSSIELNQEAKMPEPSEETLNKISKDPTRKASFYRNLPPDIEYNHEIELEQLNSPDLTLEQAKESYYKKSALKIVYNKNRDNIKRLTDAQLLEHYKNKIIAINKELNVLKKLKEAIKKRDKERGLPTPNNVQTLTRAQEKKKELYDICVELDNAKYLKLLLEKFNPEKYQELLNSKQDNHFILENRQTIINYIIGANFTNIEDRIFCALRYIAYEAFQKGEVSSPDQQIKCKAPYIYELSGIPRSVSGYDSRQKRLVREALLNTEGNLTKQIYIEKEENKKKEALITNFVSDLYWNDKDNTTSFKINQMFFVNTKKNHAKDYFIDDIFGRNRFMSSLKKGNQNEGAYRLHKYLAEVLKKKNGVMSFNVTTLMEQSGLMELFNDPKGRKNQALNKLQNYLNVMYKCQTLLKEKPIKTSSKSDEHGKYELVRMDI